MRFWRRSTPGPDSGADALAEETKNRQPDDETPVDALEPEPAPEADGVERNPPAEPLSGDAGPAELGQWSGGFWRRSAPEPGSEDAEAPPAASAPDST